LTFAADVPGTYVITLTPTASTTATAATVTFVVLPTTTPQAGGIITAAQSAAAGVAATANTITVTRGAGVANTDGQILGRVISTADSTDFPVGRVFGKVAGTTDLTAVTVGGTAATPTFAIARTNLATGSYTVNFFVDANSNGLFDTGEVNLDVTFTVVAAATAIAVSLSNPIAANVPGYNSVTITATITDPASTPLVTETLSTGVAALNLDLTNLAAGTPMVRVGTTNTYQLTIAVDANPASAADFADTYLTVHVGTLSTTAVQGTAALRVVVMGDLAATGTIEANDAVGIGTYNATTGLRQSLSADATTGALTVDPAVTSITFTGTAAAGQAGEYVRVTVTPTSTCVSSAAVWVPILADLSFTHTVTGTCATATSYTVAFDGAANDAGMTVTFTTPAPRWSTSPASFKAKYADKVSLTGTLSDQYGRALSSKEVTATVTGRNPLTKTLTTNANGQVTLEYTDASASTTVLVDSMTFSYVYLATATATTSTTLTSTAVTATFSATGVVVGSIVLTEDNTANTETIENAYVSGLPGTLTTYTATLKTATGAPVEAGVIVTFSGGADDIFYGSKVGVTDAFGQATVTVHRQKAGYAAISASAGGVTSNTAGAVLWSNSAGDRRHLAISANQSITPGSAATIVATVTDRFGNPVNGVTVTFSISGAGRLVAGDAVGNKTTNINGQAQIQVTSLATETGVLTALVTAAGGQFTDPAGFVGSVVAPGVKAGNTSASSTVTFAAAATPEVVVPPVAPTLNGSLNGRVLLFGSCQADEGDLIIYVKSPGKPWQEKAKTLECAAGEFDGSIRAPKTTKFFRVKQEGTGLWSSSVLIRR
jgi:hypothetical protein